MEVGTLFRRITSIESAPSGAVSRRYRRNKTVTAEFLRNETPPNTFRRRYIVHPKFNVM